MSSPAGGAAALPSAYYCRVNGPLLELLPPDLGAVLDVGCGAGALGGAYKERFPASAWTGIEMVAEAAMVARGHLDHVIEADAEFVDGGTLPAAAYDAIIYADSLEHFRDPRSAIARHLRSVKPNGIVCASVPNVQHWSAILGLVSGRWDYRDEGLFDRTHLRFFTLDTMVEFLREAGCSVEAVVPLIPRSGAPLIPDWSRHEAFMEYLKRIAETFDLRFDERRFLAYQYVVRARWQGT